MFVGETGDTSLMGSAHSTQVHMQAFGLVTPLGRFRGYQAVNRSSGLMEIDADPHDSGKDNDWIVNQSMLEPL